MNSFFAAVFSSQGAAREARRELQSFDDDKHLDVVASVVLVKGDDGTVSEEDGQKPGALGAGLGGLVGGIIGLVGGPVGAILGAAGGAMSGGWFDLMRVEERATFLNEVAGKIAAGSTALLAEVVNPSSEAKAAFENRVHELGGTVVLKDSSPMSRPRSAGSVPGRRRMICLPPALAPARR